MMCFDEIRYDYKLKKEENEENIDDNAKERNSYGTFVRRQT